MFMVFIYMDNIHPELLKRYTEGDCSDEEKREVEAWLDAVDVLPRATKMPDPQVKSEIWGNIVAKAYVKKRFQRNGRWAYPLIAASLILVAGIAFFKNNIFDKELRAVAMIRYTAPAGRVSILTLPDQSTLRLAGGSSVEYPEHFDKDSRMLNFVHGEAFFVISHNANWPFVVNTSGSQIKVLGTRFNINHTSSENLSVTLTEGAISFKNGRASEKVLAPGQELHYDLITHQIKSISEVDTNYVMSWTRGELWFKNTPMKVVLERLERYYGVTFSTNGAPDLEIPLTARLDKQSLSRVLKLIENSTSLKFKQIRPNNIVIY